MEFYAQPYQQHTFATAWPRGDDELERTTKRHTPDERFEPVLLKDRPSGWLRNSDRFAGKMTTGQLRIDYPVAFDACLHNKRTDLIYKYQE